jgi:hypothetical protein
MKIDKSKKEGARSLKKKVKARRKLISPKQKQK